MHASTHQDDRKPESSRAQRERLGQLARRFLVPTVMVAIGLLHQGRAVVYDQSSWIGCGFGMFATLDNHITRIVRVTDLGSEGPKRLTIEPRFESLAHHVRVVPTPKNLQRLAIAMKSTLHPQTPLRLDLYHIAFSPQENRIDAKLKQTFTQR